ncbi:unnamed protein product [Dovyalis caffra]|uniref:Uncharacterized protein n=1 Tax=Dovyalis caffra TaxID=77055 RepID=A0AAV1STI8_9ROSI|nr:unnamed protein product [Dovyalis caffra]
MSTFPKSTQTPSLSYDVNDEVMEWLSRSSVDYARSSEVIPNLHEYFPMEGVSCVLPKPTSGNAWLDLVKPWEPELVATERFTRLFVDGVPLHAWDVEFFKFISASFGKFITMDHSAFKKLEFDVGRILLNTSLRDFMTNDPDNVIFDGNEDDENLDLNMNAHNSTTHIHSSNSPVANCASPDVAIPQISPGRATDGCSIDQRDDFQVSTFGI